MEAKLGSELRTSISREEMRNVPVPAWSSKDERQYEHIKDSSLDRGVNEDTAEEIAARTVNKRRRQEGRTPNVRTQGTGNPNVSLEERSRDEVYNRARELHIRGRSTMTKSELVEAVRGHRERG
jgi:plasmid stabilization system protein ParE